MVNNFIGKHFTSLKHVILLTVMVNNFIGRHFTSLRHVILLTVMVNNFIGRHFTSLRHVILILSKQGFALTTKCCMLSRGVAVRTNYIVCDPNPMIKHTFSDNTNHCTANAVLSTYKTRIKDSYFFTSIQLDVLCTFNFNCKKK